ncbi:MAG: hypothetical protein Q9186_005221 [Xanthomendoza sp. 1 TL-2023]
MPPFKDEHILVIAPGSQTTLAQLGLPESFTPAQLRVSTRMFPAEKKGEWEPIKVRERRITKQRRYLAPEPTDGDTSMADLDGQVNRVENNGIEMEDTYFEEDPTTEDGAVYPIRQGRVVDWSCLFALMSHIYNTLSPPFHTPILIVTQPAWTAQDHETLTQFFFEKFKTPAFCLMDAALAVCYAYSASTATVVDVGYEKCDVTAVNDFLINDVGRGTALTGCGGESMTQRLLELLSSKGLTRDMCEQLKRSGICEVLPQGTAMPGESEVEEANINPAAAASTGANAAGLRGRGSVGDTGALSRGDTGGAEGGQDSQDGEGEDDEGVIDVATIVASGKTGEFLARKEKEKAEKAEKAATKKAAQEAANAPKQAKLPNAKRMTATFHYTERRPLEELNQNGKRSLEDGNQNGEGQSKRPKTPELQGPDEVASTEPASASGTLTNSQYNGESTALVRRDVEVGIERFQAATGGILDHIADAIHRCVLSVPDIGKRGEFWDNLVFVGNGSKVRGFKDALIAKLNSKYLISPSSATIFTSELPSNFTTPVATGANTPQPQSHISAPHHGPGVNPLLAAAVTASNPGGLAPPGQAQHLHAQLQMQQYQQQQQNQHAQHQHVGHGQTPTSIKLMKMPEYFPEWKDAGTEEAAFLGAQVAAKVVFVVDQGLSKGFMSRTEYNDLGPQGIHEFCM